MYGAQDHALAGGAPAAKHYMTATYANHRTISLVSSSTSLPSNDTAGEIPDSAMGAAADRELADFVHRAGSNDQVRLPAYRAFKSQIDQYPVLSREAQDDLFLKIQQGRAARARLEEMAAGGKRDIVQERRHKRAVRAGEEATEYLVGSNLRLVLVIAGDLASKRLGDRAFSLLPDLVQEGNLGLMTAIERFDLSYGVPFYTYAAKYIRQHVRDALVIDKHIKVPTSWVRVSRIAAGVTSRLKAENKTDPSMEEVWEQTYEYCMEWAYKRVPAAYADDPEAGAKAVLKKQGILSALNDLDEVLRLTQHMTELDAPVGHDGDSVTTVGELYVDTTVDEGAYDGAELEELREALLRALDGLKDREREIILLRYGFEDGERWTYARLGERFGITAERIRQIEQKVLSRLATPTAQHTHLSSFLDSRVDQAIDDNIAAHEWER